MNALKYIFLVFSFGLNLLCIAQSSDALFNKGYSCYERGKYEEAIDWFHKAISKDHEMKTQDYIKYYNIGLNYSHIDSFEVSNKFLDTAIFLNPSIEKAYGERGINYMLMGDNGSAIAEFSKAIKLNPDSKSRFNRGYAYFSEENYESAYTDIVDWVELNGKDFHSYIFLTKCKSMLKDIKCAEKYYNLSKELDGTSNDILEAGIWIEANRNNLNKAKLKRLLEELKVVEGDDYAYTETIERFSKVLD